MEREGEEGRGRRERGREGGEREGDSLRDCRICTEQM